MVNLSNLENYQAAFKIICSKGFSWYQDNLCTKYIVLLFVDIFSPSEILIIAHNIYLFCIIKRSRFVWTSACTSLSLKLYILVEVSIYNTTDIPMEDNHQAKVYINRIQIKLDI